LDDDLTRRQLIGELVAAMGTADSDDRRSQRQWLERAATILRAHRPGVRSLLDMVRTDPSLTDEVAARSYWHSNGFAKLLVHLDPATDVRLRLHVWSADRAAGYENVHDHRWPFASMVLCGALEVEEFSDVDADRPGAVRCTALRYDGADGRPDNRLVPTGKTGLRSMGRRRYGAPGTHVCDTGVLHAVRALDGPLTSTLVVQGAARSRTARVYQRVDRAPLEDTGEAITPAEVVGLVSATLSASDWADG
jgi:hypothetical protein